MGLSDTFLFEVELPEYGIRKGDVFETKSLYAGGAEYAVNAVGQLIESRRRYDSSPDSFDQLVLRTTTPETREKAASRTKELMQQLEIKENVLCYHGDILLHGSGPDGSWRKLVVRFTNGKLEWVRDAADYPKDNLELLVEQGAR